MTSIKSADRQAEAGLCWQRKLSVTLVFELILNLNIAEALARLEAMITFHNSFEQPF